MGSYDVDSPRYLSAADVQRALPAVPERLELARRAMLALVRGAQLPAKTAVHPRPEASFAHAMPAWVRGDRTDGRDDLLGIKWVTGFQENREIGLPAIQATVLLSDPQTGMTRAILDGGPITAHRTAAVTGLCVQAWGPAAEPSNVRVAVVGAGVQARSHLPVLAYLLPGCSITISDRKPGAAEELAAEAAGSGFSGATVEPNPARAVDGAQLVITLVSFGPDRQAIPEDAFADAALVVAVDYDMCVPAAVAKSVAHFIVDERGQFLTNRGGGIFTGYPDPEATIGEALPDGPFPGRSSGRTLVTHLGVGVADLVFADAVLKEGVRLGLGQRLPA